MDKIEQIIQDLSGGKAPGPDGIIADFYNRSNNFVYPLLLKRFAFAIKVTVSSVSF